MDDFSLPTLAAFGLIVAVSGLVHGTLGMGFPVLATPLLALFVDVRTAILITLLPTAAVNLGSVLQGGNWRASVGRFWPLALCSLAGSALGTQILVALDPAPFKLLLAALVVLYLLVSGARGFGMPWVLEHFVPSMLAFGLLAGLAGGTTNVMVPILIIYTLELRLERTTMIQVFNLCFLVGKLSQITVFAHAGLLTVPVLAGTAPLAAVAVLMLLAGMRLRNRIPADTYRRAIKTVLALLAALLVAQYLAGHA